jgi:hypothetical protein
MPAFSIAHKFPCIIEGSNWFDDVAVERKI